MEIVPFLQYYSVTLRLRSKNASMSQPEQRSLGTNLTYTCDDGLGLRDRATQFYVTCEKRRAGVREWVKPNSTECLGTDSAFCKFLVSWLD